MIMGRKWLGFLYEVVRLETGLKAVSLEKILETR